MNTETPNVPRNPSIADCRDVSTAVRVWRIDGSDRTKTLADRDRY
jgi:hypothetical protein